MSEKQLGPYRLGEVLGRGGMGTVYFGVNEDTNEQVAVKVLNTLPSHQTKLRRRFEAEIETLLKLDHPNIVRLKSYGQEDGQLFFAMELVKGASLFELQSRGTLFNWKRIVEITLDVCAGLRHAHDRGVIHRDLKPGNLLVEESGLVKLTDFGIAKLFGGAQMTVDGGVVGTTDYMSPEQAMGEVATVQSDLYSLGAVMYSLLARRPPFKASSLPEMIRLHREEYPAPVSRYAPDVPPELESIIAKLLERDPAKRFRTALALSTKLKQLLEVVSVQAEADTDASLDPDVEMPHDSDPENLLGAEASSAALLSDPDSLSGADDTKRSTSKPQSNRSFRASQPTIVQKGPVVPYEEGGVDYFTSVTGKPGVDFTGVASDPEEKELIWPYALGLLIVLSLIFLGIGMTYWWKPSADDLMIQIEAARDEGNLSDVSDEMTEFVEQYPDDPRAKIVRQWQGSAEADELPRRVERDVQRRGIDSLSPVQIEFYSASQLATTDPSAAASRFQALVDAYEEIDLSLPDQDCIEAAKIQVQQLAEYNQAHYERTRRWIERALARSDQLRKTDPERADAVCRGLLELYRNESFADDLMEEARTRLQPKEEESSRVVDEAKSNDGL